MTTTGTLFDVKRFSVHDGPGVRTPLFLKGCPLNCLWCHNPESVSPRPQLAFHKHKCIQCGECAAVCPRGAHTLVDGIHQLKRAQCAACGQCETACLGNALRLYGVETTVDEAVDLVLEDRDFHGPDGGATLSGGEPLLQPDFCGKLLGELKRRGVHTAVDTCGCVGWDVFESIIPSADIFRFDFKHPDDARHRDLTGRGNEQILSNLRRLANRGARIEIRIPLIPGRNDSAADLHATGQTLTEMRIDKVKILPYHAMSRTKYAALSIPDPMPDVVPPDDDAPRRAASILRSHGIKAM